MSAPAAKARSPAPVRTIAPTGRVGVERLERVRELVEEVEAQRVERLGPVERDQRDAGQRRRPAPRRRAPARERDPRRRLALWLRGRARVGHVRRPPSVVRTVSTRGEAASSISGASSSTRSVDEPGRDLAQVAAGRAHRVRGEAGIEAGPVVERHRGDQDEVGLAAERLAHPLDRVARRPGVPATSGRCSAA